MMLRGVSSDVGEGSQQLGRGPTALGEAQPLIDEDLVSTHRLTEGIAIWECQSSTRDLSGASRVMPLREASCNGYC